MLVTRQGSLRELGVKKNLVLTFVIGQVLGKRSNRTTQNVA